MMRGTLSQARGCSSQTRGLSKRLHAPQCSLRSHQQQHSSDHRPPSNLDLASSVAPLSFGGPSHHRTGAVLEPPAIQQHPHNEEQMAVARRSLGNMASTASTSSPAATQPGRPRFRTVMLKVSGEALQGNLGHGVDPDVVHSVAREVKAAVDHGIRVAIVVGGGNYFRGASGASVLGLERATADYVGMLATVMNALQLQGALEKLGVETRVQTAIEMREVAEPYIRRRAISHLEANRVVIFGAGTGNPFFTTDTAAALRAAEVNAEVLLKATKVDGVYDSDPKKNPGAKRYKKLSYREVFDQGLGVMDETAVTLCKENNIPVIVFDIMTEHNILHAALGKPVGTVVCESAELAASMDFND